MNRFLLFGLALVATILVIRAPWSAGFWLDESLTAWIVKGDRDFFNRVTEQPQSIAYHFLLMGWVNLFGASEISLRVPSVALTLVSLLSIFLIARNLGGLATGLIGALVWISHEQSVVSMLSARPYAFGVAAVMIAALGLISAGEGSSHGWKFGIVCGLAGAVAAQPLFIVAYIPLVVLAWHTLRCEPEVNRRRAWGAFIVGSVIGLGALGFQAYVVLQSTPLAFARNPSIVDLFLGIVPGPTAVIAGTSVIIGGIYSVKSVRELRSVLRAPFFVWLWVLLAPIGFFLGSQCLPAGSFWVPRYWGWQSAGLALLIGIVLGRMVQARHGWIAALVLVAGLTWRELGREWKLEGWREVASTIHQQSGDKSPPLVLLASGLVEQRDEMWILDPKHRPYLASPLAMYDVSLAEVLPVLESTEEKMEKFFRGQVIGRVGDRERLWLVGMQGSKAGVIIESGVLRKYTSLIQEMGFEARERREFGLVMLYEFHRKVSSLG